MASADGKRTCFVGGYMWFVDEVDLRMAFSRFGPVERIEMPLDEAGFPKSYAFVTFEDKAHMWKAVRGMDGKALTDGRPESEFFPEEYFYLSLNKLVVRPGTTVVDFLRECRRCSHVGHTARHCDATDPSDPRHEFKGPIVTIFKPYRQEYVDCYVMTEEDWPLKPPPGWTAAMYQQVKRCCRVSPECFPGLIPLEPGQTPREAVARNFKSMRLWNLIANPRRKTGLPSMRPDIAYHMLC